MKPSKSILLVDDDIDDQCFFLEALCEIENATLFGIANNGKDAYNILVNAAVLPDIIFMDINMPVMNGIECLARIMFNAEINHIPVVMLTTSSWQKEVLQLMGAKAFIKKPNDLATLNEKVAQMINMDFMVDTEMANRTFHSDAIIRQGTYAVSNQ